MLTSYSSKTYTGKIINNSSTLDNGRFTVTVEFDNDKNVKIGMTANITI